MKKILDFLKDIIANRGYSVLSKGINFFNNANLINKGIEYFNNFIKNKEINEFANKKLYTNDLISARSRDAMLNKIKGSNKRANFLTFFIFISLICLVSILFFYINEINSEGIAIIGALIGVLIKCLYKIFVFEFGGVEDEKNDISQEVKDAVEEEKNKYETNSKKNKKNN